MRFSWQVYRGGLPFHPAVYFKVMLEILPDMLQHYIN